MEIHKEVIEVRQPVTGEVSGCVDASTEKDVVAAVRYARAAQRTWGSIRVERRASVLRKFHDLLISRSREVLDVIQSESGKSRRDALTELAVVASTARYYSVHGPRHLGSRATLAPVPGITRASMSWMPHGVVGLITPWNFPLILGVGDALPALLAGNTVVTKPSEMTPLSVEFARELLIEAGLPEHAFIAVNGSGADIGPALIENVDYVGFTGSATVGQVVAHHAIDGMKPFSLELGGKNPMIVAPGARIRDAVTGLVNSTLFNAGQTCIGIERVYVHESMFDEFTRALAERFVGARVGWSNGWDVDMGCLVSDKHADKVEKMVDQAIEAGAVCVTGGRRLRNVGSSFYAPTVLTGVDESMDLHRQEVFGPVVSVYPYSSEEEAVEMANDSHYGLNASVWASSRSEGERIAKRINAGSVCVNSVLLVYFAYDAPLGGVRSSGMGRRHGAEGIRRFTRAHTIATSVGKWGGFESLISHMTSQRRESALLAAIRAWRHVPGIR